jgi:hypothetical protein
VPDPFYEPGDEDPAAGPGEGGDAAAAWQALRDSLGSTATASAHSGELRCVELCPICRAADLLRASGSPEVRGQVGELQREALLTLRALLDHYIERLETPPDSTEAVEDIPID